ncbi:MAG TPA: ATP-binding protein [Drouetiella sp.]
MNSRKCMENLYALYGLGLTLKLKLSIWHKLLLLVLIPLVFEICFALVLAGLLEQAEEQADQFAQSKEVLMQFNLANRTLVHTMSRIVTDESTTTDKGARIDKAIAEVRQALKSMQNSGHLVPELEDVLRPAPQIFESAIQVVETSRNDFVAQRPSFGQLVRMRQVGMPIMLEINQMSHDLLAVDAHMKVAEPRELERTRRNVFAFLLFGTAASVLISIAAAWFFFRDILKRLNIIKENAHLLAIRLPVVNAVRGGDELTKLNIALQKGYSVLESARNKELSILDAATDVICSTDRRLRITAAGAASLDTWGYKSEDLLGRSIVSLQSKDSEGPFRAVLEELMESEQSGEVESQVVCANMALKDFNWKINWSAENQSFYCVAHDVTEQRNTERMKQHFVAIVGHDLRTPLSSISATLSVLLANTSLVSEKATQILQKAEASLERLMDLIRDLLDLEKLEAGKVVLDFGVVSALDVCNAACDSVEYLAQKLHVTLTRSNQDFLMRGDERRLVRVLVNLISNAIKFSPRGGTVAVSMKAIDNQIEISIIDEGPGIPLEDQSAIFEKFRQTTTSRATEVKGTGLGLAIAKLIVEAHDGIIGVDSQVGKGSRFYIRLPKFMGDNDE